MAFILSLSIAIIALFVWKKIRDNSQIRMISLIVGIGAILLTLRQVFTIIPAGTVGVQDFFGKVSNKTLHSGINLRNPLARIVKFSIKTQEIKETMDVPSREGLNVGLGISILFHLDPEKAPDVYKTVGQDYVDIILVPQFRSVVRGVTASYDAKALYTSEREILSQTILKEVDNIVKKRGIIVEATPLRSISLPSGLSKAIEMKLEAEQESQRMQFVLQKEQQEADRKRIEAHGIADFQKIVTQGISEQLLRWKGIEATEKLASSQNAKIVIIGGKDGLPIILNDK